MSHQLITTTLRNLYLQNPQNIGTRVQTYDNNLKQNMEDFSEKSTRPLKRYLKNQTMGLVYSESTNIGIR